MDLYEGSYLVQEERGLGETLADIVDPPKLRHRWDARAWVNEKNIELWSKQHEIMDSVVHNPNTAVRSCHGIGKSFSAALTCCWWLDTHPIGEAFVVTSAPTDKQVKAILWREINKMHSRYSLYGHTNLSEWYMGKELVAFGRKPSDYDPTAFQGIHARYLLVVLDEACGIPKELWDAAATLATNTNSRILAIGNPDDEFSEFKAKTDSPDWHGIRVAYWDTPNFTGEKVSPRLREMLISKKWVDERRRDWGEGSALFTSKCEGEFPHGTSPFTVIPVTWLDSCRVEDVDPTSSNLRPPPGAARRQAGIDIGAGGDRTVVWVRDGQRAVAVKAFREADPMKSAGAIALFLRENDVAVAKIDPIGVGWALAGKLKETSSHHTPGGVCAHSAQIIGINFAEKPNLESDQKKYVNKRAQAWWNGRELSRLQRWDLREVDHATLQELSTPQYKIVDSSGKILIQKKEEVIKVLGRSPDSGDALLLAFWEATSSSEMADTALAGTNLLAQVQPGDWALGAQSHGIGSMWPMNGNTPPASGGWGGTDLLGRR